MSIGTVQRTSKLDTIKRSVAHKVSRLRRWASWKLKGFDPADRRVLLLVGCQRSGTTLLADVFEKDERVTVFQEESRITGKGDERIRLRDLKTVNSIFSSCPTPLIVAKPLVESQRTREMLDQIPGSHAVWIIRHFADVVNSNLHRFVRQQVRNLIPMVEDDPTNWRAQNMSEATREVVKQFYAPTMERADAAALMWYARNRLYFEQELDRNPRVTLCRYESLVQSPGSAMQRLYEAIGVVYPGDEIVSEVDSRSLGKGRSVSIRPEIEALCRELQDQFGRQA